MFIRREPALIELKLETSAVHEVASKILPTINAPYSEAVSAVELAEKISSMDSVQNHDHAAFAFLSEVSLKLQREFIGEMHLDESKVAAVAQGFSKLAGYKMPLAR